MLDSRVLVLNRSYMPIHVTSARRAFRLIYQEVARALSENYQTFDFQPECVANGDDPGIDACFVSDVHCDPERGGACFVCNLGSRS